MAKSKSDHERERDENARLARLARHTGDHRTANEAQSRAIDANRAAQQSKKR